MNTGRLLLGTRVDVTSYESAVRAVLGWAELQESRSVCIANVHMIMEAYDGSDFRSVVNGADLVTPDGMPLVCALRLLGAKASRVYGPDLTPLVLAAAAEAGVPVGFYGGSGPVLERLLVKLRDQFPALRIGYAWAPPFRPLTAEEDAREVAAINDSGARILLLGLGCPKQERWMAEHKGRIQCVMLGVGAAFDFLAGAKPQAPRWMMRCGLEWVFRLACEPRRLWKRYLKHNPRFVVLFAAQLLKARLARSRAGRDLEFDDV